MGTVLVYVCDVCGTERRDGGASTIELRASGNDPTYWSADVRACDPRCLEKGYALLPKQAQEAKSKVVRPPQAPVETKHRVSTDRF